MIGKLGTVQTFAARFADSQRRKLRGDRGKTDTTDIEEASRLLFVSMTRAKVELYLCHARIRTASVTYLQNSFALRPSPFIKAIPKELLEIKYIPAESSSQGGNRKAQKDKFVRSYDN